MEAPAAITQARRNEDIALDLMKFVASATGYGRGTTATGFQGATTVRAEEYAEHLLALYRRCLSAVEKKS